MNLAEFGTTEALMTTYRLAQGIFVLLLGVCSLTLLAQDSRPRETIPPTVSSSAINPFTLAVVAEVNKSTREITYKYTHLRPMVLTETGQDGVRVQTVRLVPETITTKVPLAGFLLYDAKGSKLTVDAFVGRVKRADVIVIYAGGRLPDPTYLRVFKDDTLILVRGDANTAPIFADPNSPPGYAPNPH
jgi:hypothetical protein